MINIHGETPNAPHDCQIHGGPATTAECTSEGISIQYSCGCQSYAASSDKVKLVQHGDVLLALDSLAASPGGRDAIMEWVENEVLRKSKVTHVKVSSLREEIRFALGNDQRAERFRTYLQEERAPAGQVLIRQGDPPKGIYFIESGRVTARLGPVRLAAHQVLLVEPAQLVRVE